MDLEENGVPAASTNEANSRRCTVCGLEYFPHVRRDSDDRLDKLFGLDVVSALNTVMDLLHASHDRPGTSEGAFAAWNWLAGLRQMFGPEDSTREWAHQIVELRSQLADFGKAAARQESLETVLVAHGGQTPVVRTRCASQLAMELLAELSALEHIWKKPSRARRPSKHTLGTLELKLLKVGFSEREIAKANFDDGLPGSATEETEAGKRAINAAVERVKKRIKAAEKHTETAPEPAEVSGAESGARND